MGQRREGEGRRNREEEMEEGICGEKGRGGTCDKTRKKEGRAEEYFFVVEAPRIKEIDITYPVPLRPKLTGRGPGSGAVLVRA